MGSSAGKNLRWSAWNLLLLIPFLMLITPVYNSVEPRLFGMPYFYWLQFAVVPVAVICVVIVYRMTGDKRRSGAGDERTEGAGR